MKVSLNWAQLYSNVDLKAIPKDELIERIGRQLAGIDEVIEWGPRYDGIVVVKVVNCEQHPNADKLHVCKVDDGGVVEGAERDENGYVQVVCGAPNVAAGLTVAWLPVGSTVPSTLEKDPFVLEARDLRGVMSNGMLASATELGLSDNHDGILIIDPTEVGEALAVPGTPFKQLYGLDDIVIDCENKMFTHRPDCFGILGVARELAGITHQKFVSPEWYLHAPTFKNAHDLTIKVEVSTELVPRFMAVAMNGITIAPSPMYIQAGLTRVGIRPINNIVDITNWMMQLTGQPLHAYDYDKLLALCGSDATLQARLSKKGEIVSIIGGKSVELDDKTIVIATDKQIIGIGGVMGGADTEVDEHTKNIIIEAATFDMYSIRKTAMKYGLFTDAVTRFNKGQSPLQNDRVLVEAMRMVAEYSKGSQASSVVDYKSDSVQIMPLVSASADFINARLGSQLTVEQMETLLENVECAALSGGASDSRSVLKGVGAIDEKLTRVGIKIVEKTPEGYFKLLIPAGLESEYEKIVSWEMQPGFWNEYIGAKNVFLFKDPDTKVVRYEVSDDNEHEIIEMCRTYANDYYTSLEAMLANNDWYKPLLPLHKIVVSDAPDANNISITPPFWRRDIELPEDLVEEVGRLYGFEKLPVILPSRSAAPTKKNEALELAQTLRELLASAGANEVLTYSFVHSKLIENVGQDPKDAYHIRNAISPELQYYRLSLTPSLLDKVHMNSKAGYDRFALFEIGIGHRKEKLVENLVPEELKTLALVFAGKAKKEEGAAFYQACAYLDFIATKLNLQFRYVPIEVAPDDAVLKPFAVNRSAFVYADGVEEPLGIVGEYRSEVRSKFKLPLFSAGFEIGTVELQRALAHAQKHYSSLPRYPTSQQDATFDVAATVTYSMMLSSIVKAAATEQAEHGYNYDITPGTIFVPEEGNRKRLSFKFTLSHPERTLTTEEVNKFLDEISKNAAVDCAAKRI